MERRLRAAGIRTSAQLCAATREHLRAAWGGIKGERYWLMLRGFDVPERRTTRSSIGHSHVLGPELRSFEGMRAVLFKLLAKAAMRMRHEGYLAGGMAIRIRFLGLERRFERDLPFAPIDDTPTLLRLLGEQLQSLDHAIDRRHWNPARHPPLSVAVTLVGLEPAVMVSAELMQERERAQRVSTVLDRINGRYGNNALYFGAMQQALAANAAPMRIPFSTIPDTALEQDVAAKSAPRKPIRRESDNELWLQRERQFKVLAEHTHREAVQKRKPFKPSGVGGWTPRRNAAEPDGTDVSERGLF
jgi:DNA polymerase-4